MALLFMDGCDHYGSLDDALAGDKWDSVGSGTSYEASGGRFGGGALRTTLDDQFWRKKFTTASPLTVIVQAAMFIPSSATFSATDVIMSLDFDGSQNISFTISGGVGTIQVRRGGVTGNLLATSDTSLIKDAWNYLEIKLFISDTVGTVIIKQDGNETLNATGLDTKNGAAALGTNGISLGNVFSTSIPIDWDDIICMDDTGSVLNDFLGDVRIETIYPDDDGTTTDFTPTGAGTTNADRVDDGDAGPDDDTTYVESSTVGHIDLYTMANLATADISAIHAVQAVNFAKKDDAGSRTSRNLIRTGTTTDNGPSNGLNEVYSYATNILEEDPDTATQWTESGVNGVEVGHEVLT
jgi:hypothetical protein